MTCGAADPAEPADRRWPEAAAVASRYETLRKAALGEPAPPECRSGLVLFLRRGMWAWARTLAAVDAPADAPPPLSSFSPMRSTAPHRERSLIQVFAAMALHFTTGNPR